jgi:hypothetical protein
VKSSLQAAEIKNVAVWAVEKRQVMPKIGQIRYWNISGAKQAYSKEALGHSAVFKFFSLSLLRTAI